MKKLTSITLIIVLVFTSCDIFEYHQYDTRVKYKNINKENLKRIERITEGKKEFNFILMGDSQRSYDETRDFVSHVNDKMKDVDFVIHGGDLTDFGMYAEFELNHEIMTKLKVPYIALIGNHDMVATGGFIFREMYGKEDFSFIIDDIGFLCINNNALEVHDDDKYHFAVPDFEFINTTLDSLSKKTKRTICVMHASPQSEQVSKEVGEKLHTAYKTSNNLMFCLNAHGHYTVIRDLFKDGIMYYQCSAIFKRSFLYFKITPEGYTYEEINY